MVSLLSKSCTLKEIVETETSDHLAHPEQRSVSTIRQSFHHNTIKRRTTTWSIRNLIGNIFVWHISANRWATEIVKSKYHSSLHKASLWPFTPKWNPIFMFVPTFLNKASEMYFNRDLFQSKLRTEKNHKNVFNSFYVSTIMLSD